MRTRRPFSVTWRGEPKGPFDPPKWSEMVAIELALQGGGRDILSLTVRELALYVELLKIRKERDQQAEENRKVERRVQEDRRINRALGRIQLARSTGVRQKSRP